MFYVCKLINKFIILASIYVTIIFEEEAQLEILEQKITQGE